MIYLTSEEVLEIQAVQLNLYGGLSGLLKPGLLQSVILAPAQSIFGQDAYPTIYDKAATYAFNISEWQIFNDGNKRAGIASALQFLIYNGHYVHNKHDLKFYDMMMEIANKTKTKDDLTDLFRTHSYKI